MKTRRAGSGASVAAAIGMVIAVVVTAPPAAADIVAISPSNREVDPGGSVTATVTVRASGLTCVNARPSDPALQPSFSSGCDDEPEWRTTLFVQAPQEPGTYSVRVTDDQSGEAGGRTFTLRVRAPPPPPPTTTAPTTTAPTTTAPPATTTTRPPTTTTTATATTTATTAATSTTTVAETTTTTSAPAPLGGNPFSPLAALVERAVPAEGLFLPLVGDGYRACLPLTRACGDPGSGLVLVPARSSEITWRPVDETTTLAPRSELRGIAPLAAVGVEPLDPRTQNYALSVLDLTAPGGQLRTLVRSLDDRGALGVVSVEQPLVRAVADGPAVELTGTTSIAAMPFGRPSIRQASSFTEAAPAVPMFASTNPQVIYAVRPDVAWGLNLELVPLLGESVPLLVRGVDGPPGLFVPRPTGLRVPEAAVTPAADDDAEAGGGGGGGGGLSGVVLLGGAVALGVVATVATALVRRRRSAPEG